MKAETLFDLMGEVDEQKVENAGKAGSAKTGTRVIWFRLAAVAACLCLVLAGAFAVPTFLSGIGPEDVEGPYSFTIAYAGWSDSQELYSNAINSAVLTDKDTVHLPVFKMDTLEDLQQFKTNFETVLVMDQGYGNIKSFEDTLQQAQWDREIYYVEHSMLAIYIPANSGSLRFCLDEVIAESDSLCISVEQYSDPEYITDDMAGWFLFVGVEKDEIQKYTSFDAILTSEE